eukprot:934691-Rhodomonas_salina.2
MGLLLGDGIGTHGTAYPAARGLRGAGARTGSTGRSDGPGAGRSDGEREEEAQGDTRVRTVHGQR